jgi:hypothetical protein
MVFILLYKYTKYWLSLLFRDITMLIYSVELYFPNRAQN